jgi:hypothetical protein
LASTLLACVLSITVEEEIPTFPGIMNPARYGLMTLSDSMMFVIPKIMQQGIVKTSAMIMLTK